MATTRLIPIHIGKGRSIADALSKSTDYAKNPDKTNGGEFVTAYGCDFRTVDSEFLLSKRQYLAMTGREQPINKNILAYQIRQSFKPGEITPEESNRMGYELAMSFTKGRHAFIVATHQDKAHIHNHIIFNSTTLDCTRKFKDFFRSARAVRRISDKICIENGFSIVDTPKSNHGHYGKWLGDKKPVTWQEKLRQTIDAVLEKHPADIAEFIQAMKVAGYETKQGKYLSFRAPEQKKFTRLRSLGEDYTDDAIIERINGKRIVAPKRKNEVSGTVIRDTPQVNLLIDIQNSIKAKNNPGYERWAKVFNLKQIAQTWNYLSENNVTDYAKLEEKALQSASNFHDISGRIKEAERRMAEITELQKHISNYSRTRDIYVEYRKAGYNKKFYAAHETEIQMHQAAKKVFDQLGLQKLPTIKTLQTEYAILQSDKKNLYQSYRKAKDEMQEIVKVKANTDQLLRYDTALREREKASVHEQV